MSRICPAGVQLIEQACNIDPKVKAKVVDKPDGLGRHRSIEFDAATSKWLAPILDVLDDDRIKSVYYQGKGRATVVFVDDTRADYRTEYPLMSIGRVLGKLGG
jgi:hypothetical protein